MLSWVSQLSCNKKDCPKDEASLIEASMSYQNIVYVSSKIVFSSFGSFGTIPNFSVTIVSFMYVIYNSEK